MMKMMYAALIIPFLSSAEGIPLNIRYDNRGLPVVDAKILNRYHSLMIDTGSSQGLHLHDVEIRKILAIPSFKGIKQNPTQLSDLSGREFNLPRWIIPELIISGVRFKEVKLVKSVPSGLSLGDGGDPEGEVLGLDAFKEKIVMLDFKKNRLLVLDSLPTPISLWNLYPFEMTDSGLLFNVKIDNMPLTFVLDTAATDSVVFYERIPHTKLKGCRLIDKKAAELDCSTTNVNLINSKNKKINISALVITQRMPKDIEFDGLIGMSFLRGQKIILDMPGKKLYLNR